MTPYLDNRPLYATPLYASRGLPNGRLMTIKRERRVFSALLYDYNFAYIDPYEEQLRGQAGIKILWKLEVSLSL